MSYEIKHKLTSARRFLAVVAGASLLMFSFATALILYANRGALKAETIMALFAAIMLVVQGVYKDYQNKDRSNGGAGK